MTIGINPESEVHEESFVVIHPLYDAAEEKCDPSKLGLIKMSRRVRFSLLLLRAYLIFMTALFGFHMLDLAGVFHHAKR